MKNLILALLSLTIANHVYASTECRDGTWAWDCTDYGGEAASSETEVINTGVEINIPRVEIDIPRESAVIDPRTLVPLPQIDISAMARRTNELLAENDARVAERIIANGGVTREQCDQAKADAQGLSPRPESGRADNQQLQINRVAGLNCAQACPAGQPCNQQAATQIRQFKSSVGDADAPAPNAAQSQAQNAALTGANPDEPGKFTNHGRLKPLDGDLTVPSCLPNLIQGIQSTACDDAGRLCTGDTTDCEDVAGGVKRFKDPGMILNFQNPGQCQQYFSGGSSVQNQEGARQYSFDLNKGEELKRKVCRLVASGCELDPSKVGSSPTDKANAQTAYNNCVKAKASKQLHAVIVGMQKCSAIRSAGEATTGFEEGKKTTTIDGKITCKNPDGFAFDYPSCTSFVGWYNGLVAAQTGMQMYNEGDKISTGMRAQNEAAQAVATGNGQEAGVEASRKTIMASAGAEERNKLFFLAKGTAITAQLVMFVDKGSIDGQCEKDAACCKLFDGRNDDKIKNADNYFPNGGEKDKMIAEVIRAGGEAALAAMKEQELRRQAAALKAIKDQMTAPDDLVDDGVMKFCLQFPQDQKCLGPGNRVVSGGAAFRGPSFNGQNMGLGNFGIAASEDIGVEDGAASAIGGGSGKSIGDIGSTDKGALDAKAAFDAPSALKGGGGSPTISGGGGGAGASASANGLSNDPGVEGDKKETPLKMTSKSASYEGGTAYNGGGYRAGAGEKKDAEGNPFASMFGKDKGRTPSAVPEIDSPASDLFTKISNRYSEVQKRKALMDVR